ncbi:TorD/DmsD family molecular chaperone [Adlercreutzia aquisgranensis]|uniref:TorD/DmsD family molecular chaperone n=1 Tax=Adlercreutzia aquisgranensis TaxID=2941323 RepID=UPI00203AF9EB|nr:molecular chaperone TorD family protein [Adlercreutzia aquisgranensis]
MGQSVSEGVESLFAARGYGYRLLHRVFGADPAPDLVSLAEDPAFLNLLALCSESEGDAFARLGAVVSGLGTDDDAVAALKSEHTVLFVGPGKLAAPPWESMYVGQEGRLFQESTLAVRYAYAEFGFRPVGYKKVADDHLALMMDFMARMAAKSLDAFTCGNRDELGRTLAGQRSFIDEHLLNWVPRYAEDVAGARVSAFYESFANAAVGFFRIDREVIGEVQEALALSDGAA